MFKRTISLFNRWFIVLAGVAVTACTSSSAAGDNDKSADRLRSHLTTYWSNRSIADMPTDSLEQSMVDFLYIASHVSDTALRREALDSLAAAMGSCDEAYFILTDYLTEPESPIRDRQLYKEALEAMARTSAVGAYRQLQCRDILESLSLNVVGEKIADLTLTLPGGTPATLLDLIGAFQSQAVKVLFYDPECEDCERLIEAMKTTLPTDEAVVAVSLHQGYFKELPAGWSSAAIVSTEEVEDKYYLPRLPAVYHVTPAGILLEIE